MVNAPGSGGLLLLDGHLGEPALESGTAFLSEAGRTLASSLDYELTLQQVARLAVPAIADWCVIDVVDEEGGGLRRLAVAHVDPDRVDFARELSRRYPPSPNHPMGPSHVVATGEPELVSEITDALLEANAQDEEHLALLRGIGFSSYMCVPLRARGTVLGAVTCVAAESGRRFGTSDLAVLDELAHGAAVAVDNALLFRDAQEARATAEAALSQLNSLFSGAPVGLGLWTLSCVTSGSISPWLLSTASPGTSTWDAPRPKSSVRWETSLQRRVGY